MGMWGSGRLYWYAALAAVTYLPVFAEAHAKNGEHPVAFTWTMAAPAISGSATLDLKVSKILELGKASPTHTFHLPDDVHVDNGSVFLPAGSELAWSDGPRSIACEPERQKGRSTIRCLWDSDADGRLDYALIIGARNSTPWSITNFEYLIGHYIAIEFVGSDELQKPIPISSLKEGPSALQAPIYLRAHNGRNRVWVDFCARRQDYEDVCTEPAKIDLRDGKGEVDLFGYRMIANVAPDGSAAIEVTPLSADIIL